MLRSILTVTACMVSYPALAFDNTQPTYTDEYGNVWQNNGLVTQFDTLADRDMFIAQRDASGVYDPVPTEPQPLETVAELQDDLAPIVMFDGYEWQLVGGDHQVALDAYSDNAANVEHLTEPSSVNPDDQEDESQFPHTVFGTDTRVNVRANTAYPFRTHLAMSLNSNHMCSATMISPSTAITAAHCVHTGRRWMNLANATWGPGADRRDGPNRSDWLPFGEIPFNQCLMVITTHKWTGGNRHPKHDWAFLDFGRCAPAGSRLGNTTTGWLGTHTADRDDRRWFNYGYPGDSQTCAGGTCLMPSQWGTSTTWDLKTRRNRIFHRIDTHPGHSGSGVYYFRTSSDRRVVGVHAYGGSRNQGRRFNNSLFRFVSRHTNFPQ